MKYKLSDPEVNQLISVDLNKLLSKLKSDCPEFFISPETKNAASLSRIQNCISFLKTSDSVEPPLLSTENSLMGVIDGRHRIAAAKKMGYTHLYIEVPRDQKELFNCLV
jgi:hypothetical protein